jgi:hypothetical protein
MVFIWKHERFEREECKLTFGPESSVLQLAVRKYRDLNMQKNIFFCVVLRWHQIRYLKWREKHRLRAFENRALRNRFGARRDEVTEEWRRLHNE